jgi:hypothetical protein
VNIKNSLSSECPSVHLPVRNNAIFKLINFRICLVFEVFNKQIDQTEVRSKMDKSTTLLERFKYSGSRLARSGGPTE